MRHVERIHRTACVLLLLAASAAIVVSGPAWAAEGEATAPGLPTVDNLVARAAKHMADVEDLRADVTMTRGDIRGEGTLKVLRPDHMLIEATLTRPDGEGGRAEAGRMAVQKAGEVVTTLVSNAATGASKAHSVNLGTLTAYQKTLGVTVPALAELEPVNLTEYLADARRKACAFEVAGRQDDLFRLTGTRTTVRSGQTLTIDMELMVGAEDGLPRSITELTESGQPISSLAFSNVEFNVGLDTDDFALKLPEGVETIDATEGYKRMVDEEKRRQDARGGAADED